MDVLMTVEMSRADTGGEHALDLRVAFAFDCVERDAASNHAEVERFRVAEKFAGGSDERAEASGIGKRAAFGEVQMNADGERGVGVRGGDGLVERSGVGQQAGAGDDAGAMGFDDGAIDAGSHAEIVGVDDELFHESRFPQRCLVRRMDYFVWNRRGAPLGRADSMNGEAMAGRRYTEADGSGNEAEESGGTRAGN